MRAALVGGFLGERIGLRSTLFAGTAGTFLAALCLLVSPVYALRAAQHKGADTELRANDLPGE